MRATVGFIDTRTTYSIFDLPAIFEIWKRLKNPTGLLPYTVTSESEQASGGDIKSSPLAAVT